jgi:hypothetical protein
MTDFSTGPGPAPTITDDTLSIKDTPSTKDKAAEVAKSGQQAAGAVAQTASDAAKGVTQETKRQATDLLGKTRDQLTEQASVQQSSLVETLRSLGDQLGAMTEDVRENGTAVDVATAARDKARGAADWLDHRDPSEVLDEIRKFGRERPAVFLLGATVAGVVAGRLTRGVVAAHADDGAESATSVGAPRHEALPTSGPGYESAFQPARSVTP